jgi:hypothetical protein
MFNLFTIALGPPNITSVGPHILEYYLLNLKILIIKYGRGEI